MTDLERVALENWARQLSNEELKRIYEDSFYNLLDEIEHTCSFGRDDIFLKYAEEKKQILERICRERGISLW
ncbi:MAG: hypothetical protein E7435_05645 [Ruminococcaceae bacterium]|nr:hypothetical protein [Oscillospiraceae bacterium]